MNGNHHYDRVAAAIRYLTEHRDEQPSLAEAAAHVHLSKYHFQRLFQEWAGVTPKQFVRYLTHEYAREALRNGKTTLETAHAAGLSGTGRLHDLFVEFQGCTPGEWKLRGQNISIRYSVGRPAAARAVGTAIGRNPGAYLIPCHRVLRESGHPGGYRWGLAASWPSMGLRRRNFFNHSTSNHHHPTNSR